MRRSRWRRDRRRARRRAATVDEIAKYRAALQDGNPAELWEARGEELWKTAARPEEGVARAVRPRARARRRQGRLRAAAALFRRRRSRDGPRDAARLVHGDAAGLSREADAKKNPFGGPDQQVRHGGAASRTSRRESRGVKMNVALDHPKEREAYRARREDVLLPRRHARLRLRDLPRRGRQAHPAAGPAEPDARPRARRRPTRRGRRIACRRASCARSSGG